MGAKRTTITVHRSEEILPSDSALLGVGMAAGGQAGGGGALAPRAGSGLAPGGLARGTSVSSEGDLATAGELALAGDPALGQGPEGDR